MTGFRSATTMGTPPATRAGATPQLKSARPPWPAAGPQRQADRHGPALGRVLDRQDFIVGIHQRMPVACGDVVRPDVGSTRFRIVAHRHDARAIR